jgi:hypothetical protein
MPNKVRQQFKLPKIRLIQRREIWTLTIQGWLIALISIAALLIFAMNHIHSFLAVTSPIDAEVLVVEGWLPDYGLKQAFAEFESGSYHQIITTGMPLERGYYLAKYKNYANLAAATFRALGLEQDKVISVAAPGAIKDRTYASAIALREWLSKSNIKLKSINLYTHDVHARRSWLLFRQALAPDTKVGVIAAQPLNYDPKRWWRYSSGVRKIIDEFVAYIYARFISWKT